MISGDLTMPDHILDRVKASLSSKADVGMIEDAFRRAYIEEKKSLGESGVLGVLGYTMDRWTREGLKQLGRDVFWDLYRQIEKIAEVDCEFLVVGFDPRGEAQIVYIHPSGIPVRYSRSSCWSIGTGSQIALTNILIRGYQASTPIEDALYIVAESKFLSEYGPGVGRETTIIQFKSRGGWRAIGGEEVNVIRNFWEQQWKPGELPTGSKQTMGSLQWREISGIRKSTLEDST